MALKRSSVQSRSAPPKRFSCFYAAELKLKFESTARSESLVSQPLSSLGMFPFLIVLEKFDKKYKCFEVDEFGDTTKQTISTSFLSSEL